MFIPDTAAAQLSAPCSVQSQGGGRVLATTSKTASEEESEVLNNNKRQQTDMKYKKCSDSVSTHSCILLSWICRWREILSLT